MGVIRIYIQRSEIIILSVVVGAAFSIVSNLVTELIRPAIGEKKKLLFSLFFGLLVCIIMLEQSLPAEPEAGKPATPAAGSISPSGLDGSSADTETPSPGAMASLSPNPTQATAREQPEVSSTQSPQDESERISAAQRLLIRAQEVNDVEPQESLRLHGIDQSRPHGRSGSCQPFKPFRRCVAGTHSMAALVTKEDRAE